MPDCVWINHRRSAIRPQALRWRRDHRSLTCALAIASRARAPVIGGHAACNYAPANLCVQIADNVPFQTAFEGSLEKYLPNERPTLYDCTVYWYQAPGDRDPYPAVPLAERVGYFLEGRE